MSTTTVRIVNRGPVGNQSEVWIEGWKVPAVRSVRVDETVNDVHTVTITLLAERVTIEHEDEPEGEAK